MVPSVPNDEPATPADQGARVAHAGAMPEVPRCPVCGAPLSSDAPEGFCPRCSFNGALELGPEDGRRRPGADSGASGHRKSGIPNSFGEYDLLEEIACGGMGVVYRARQRSLNRIVAIKLLLFGAHATPDAIKRFRAEAVAAAALQHPNIVAVHEVGVHDGQHFIVMDYVEGQSLAARIQGEPLPARSAARYLRLIAEAIHFAHERGILHRDLKPSNILIDAGDQPRVTDFGLAKRIGVPPTGGPGVSEPVKAGMTNELTLTGQVLGSPSYMPPEQASGKRGVLSGRTDVYALGAILYHALTGRPPFVGEGMAETVQQLLNVEPVAPRLLNASVPADLENVCLKCLEKEPARRYATAQLLADELGRYLEGKPVLARPVTRLGKLWRWSRRNPHLALATGTALSSLLVGLAGVTWEWRRASANELFALQNAYAADMMLAQHAFDSENRVLALRLLDKYRPRANSAMDLRHWEWRYLWQLC